MKNAIIAGTAIYDIPGVNLKEEIIKTPYGKTTVFQGTDEYENLVFLPRHGIKHSTPPHNINYKANIKALEMIGTNNILAAYAVGSFNRKIKPLDLVLLSDFIDMTNGRPKTFYEGDGGNVEHTEMSMPYSEKLRSKLLDSCNKNKLPIHEKGVYVCTNGPRFETPAEIRMYGMAGADVVGMTGVPEVVLANELNIPFAALAFSINWAAGVEKTITVVEEGVEQVKQAIIKLFMQTFSSLEN